MAETKEETEKRIAEQERQLGVEHQIILLRKELDAMSQQISLLEKMAKLYPDLKKFTNRWNRTRWCSKSVNSLVNNCEICHSCGCCEDASVQVYSYIEIDGFKVYSDPCRVTVGERCNYNKDLQYENWEAEFNKYGISDVIINKVRDYFNSQDSKGIDGYNY